MSKRKTVAAPAMTFHWPDDPVEVMAPVLYEMERDEDERGQWIGQLKWDGWRTLLYKQNGTWVRHCKHDDGPMARTQIPPQLIAELNSLRLPDGTAFDTEWMGGRCTALLNGRHYLIIHDIHYLNGEWQGQVPYERRLTLLRGLVEGAIRRARTANIELIDSVEVGLLALYNRSKTMPLTEGVVIKRRDSLLIGSPTSPTKNPQWMKVKWRR